MKIRNFMALTAIFAVLASACTEKEPLDNPKDDNDGDNTEVVDPEQPGEGEGGDEGDQNTPVDKLFNATYDKDWTAEAVSVWDGQSANRFTARVMGSSVLLTGTVAGTATDFYAVYPYSEDASFFALENTVRTRFELPETLTEGDEPEFAFAKVDAEGNVAFHSSMAYLQVVLAEDMTDVESLTFSGLGESDYLSGLLDVTISADEKTSEFVEYDRSVSVTYTPSSGEVFNVSTVMKLPFYARNFAQGVSLSVKYTGSDEVLTVALEEPRNVAPGDVITLSDNPLNKAWFAPEPEPEPEPEPDPANSYYAIYSAGEDITIAGKTYNKATYGEGTLVKSGETADLTAGNKVYFIEPGAVATIGPKYSAAKYIVIGDNPSQRTKVTQSAAIKVGKDNSHYAFLNLHFDSTIAEATSGSDNDVLTVANSGSVIERIAYDNCHVELTGRFNIYNSNSTFKDIAYHNCDFVVTVTGHDAPLIKCDTSAEADYQSIDLQNNLFWHSSAFASKSYAFNIMLAVKTNAVDNIVMKNNTFINLRTRNSNAYYFQINKEAGTYEDVVDSAVIEGNIFYIDDAEVDVNFNILRANATAGSASNNYGYYANETTYKFYFGGKIADKSSSITTLTSSPFSSLTIDSANRTCQFTVLDAYKAYGASR